MNSKFTLALQSRTTWTIVLLFIIGGLQNVSGFLPSGLETLLMGILSGLSIYFKLNPSQNYTK